MNSKWIIIILSLLLGVLQWKLWEGTASLQDVTRLKQAILIQNEELARLTERNRQLNAEVAALKATPHALEERARSELGMIKKGETFYLIVNKASKKD